MKSDELADHLFTAVLGTFDVLAVHIGSTFGLYDLLAEPRTSAEAAAAAGMAERYCREWLEQQTVAGLIEVDDPALPAHERRYTLPAEHVPVLCDRDSLSYFTPFARIVAAAAVQLPALLEAYRTGGGVGWHQYGEVMRAGQADANRPLFLHVLGSDWLPALPEAHAALTAGGRVADIGCGDGWSAIGMALAYPAAEVDGFDLDPASIEAARAHAANYGLGDRVRFHHADVAELADAGRYDLVTAFECVHDMPDPVGVLRAARTLARPGGTVLVMDERVPETFSGPGDPVEQLMYGMSLLICLPDGLSHPGSAGTGTVMRPGTLRRYARDAGFAEVEVLDIEHDLFRLYRLHP
ncbi:class I SAM-dependent methyltransferase [Nocardia harenae]|uniref:class I SAM-dependent methyltransferase n=1 Tax=Nocardia harenae TaxID=358707 RepID=UPI00082F4F2B|nr:class I SAM-dependent methyltransferase [Nocardia harenae]